MGNTLLIIIAKYPDDTEYEIKTLTWTPMSLIKKRLIEEVGKPNIKIMYNSKFVNDNSSIARNALEP